MTNKMSELNQIQVGKRVMFDKELMCKTTDLQALLYEFVNHLESIDNSIVLVYENQFQLKYLPYVLINHLKKFDLLDRVESKVIGFIDCSLAFRNETSEFFLDLSANNLKIKSHRAARDPLYRLDILQSYFLLKQRTDDTKLDDDSIQKFDDLKVESMRYYVDKANETTVDENVDKDEDDESLDAIMQKAKNIVETKDCLTGEELRNLYLLQKFKYQYRFSRTYNPRKKAFVKLEPRKKSDKNKPKESSLISDTDKSSKEKTSHTTLSTDTTLDRTVLDRTTGENSD